MPATGGTAPGFCMMIVVFVVVLRPRPLQQQHAHHQQAMQPKIGESTMMTMIAISQPAGFEHAPVHAVFPRSVTPSRCR